MTLKPGWLPEAVHNAHMRCMLDNGPAALRHLGPVQTPVSEVEARELYVLMNTRFRQWTGADLAAYAPALME